MNKWMCGICVLLFLGVFNNAEAATLYMDPSKAEINRGDTISIGLRLDTDDGECVNTVDGVITYTENIVPVDTSRGNSILSVWLEEPTIDKANRQITFAAGIPNGYCGRIAGDPRLTNHILELIFASPGLQIGSTESGNVAKIEYGEGTRVLLNDGFGTDASLKLFDAEVTMGRTPGKVIVNEWSERVAEDDFPPQEFAITLERTHNAFSNRYFIVFNTTDKQSGIDYYEVIEEPLEEQSLFKWGAVDAPWVRAESPYVLKDQSLNSTIRVKAFDKAGNEYIATLIPDESQRTMSAEGKIMIALIIAGISLFIVAGAVFALMLRRRRTTTKTAVDDDAVDDEPEEETGDEAEEEEEEDEEYEYEEEDENDEEINEPEDDDKK